MQSQKKSSVSMGGVRTGLLKWKFCGQEEEGKEKRSEESRGCACENERSEKRENNNMKWKGK